MMNPARWKPRLVLFAAAALLAFTPLTFSAEQVISGSTAECAACCFESRSKCVRCVEDCQVTNNAYDAGDGSCS